MKGKFIVFEGIGGSGKTTQVKLLCKKFDKLKIPYTYIKFPAYNTFYGKIIQKYLKGELGELDEIPAEIPCLLYACDRYNQREKIIRYLNKEVNIISDRYIASNIAFQSAKFKSKKERKKITKWIRTVESRLPQPDTSILFNMPVSASQELLNKRGDIDIHETDLEYQERIRKNYENIAKKNKWKIINCMKKNKLKSIDNIHQEVWNHIKNII